MNLFLDQLQKRQDNTPKDFRLTWSNRTSTYEWSCSWISGCFT